MSFLFWFQHTESVHNLHDSTASSQLINNLSNNISQVSQSTPKQPQGILKHPHVNNMQILNVQNPPGGVVGIGGSSLGNNLLIGTYDPSNPNLSSFNASLGYTDADGHLV